MPDYILRVNSEKEIYTFILIQRYYIVEQKSKAN